MSHRRRRVALIFLAAGVAALAASVGVAVATPGKKPPRKKKAVAGSITPAGKLATIKHFVIVYEENHSFDNLYGGWEGVNGTAKADSSHTVQVDQNGAAFACLLQNDVNLTVGPLTGTCSATSHFVNNRFLIDSYIPATATTCPAPGVFAANGLLNGAGQPGGCTRDIVHRYYSEQFQLDGGKQNRYVLGSDAAGLAMGIYDTTALPIYKYLHATGHPHYAISDDFFQGAFGGSFLNHQWLINPLSAPVWKNALNDGSANDRHSVVDVNGMPTNTPLYTSPLPVTSLKDQHETASCNPGPGRAPTPAGVTCGDYAVNTTQSWYQPYSPGTSDALRLPPLTTPTIGDRLTAAKVDWAWYSGGWSNADGDKNGPGWTNGSGPTCSDPNALSTATFPNCPDKLFQFHHQALNYYEAYAPGTAARTAHLKDEQEFFSQAAASSQTCQLKQVSFIKPIGAENEHPGYASESVGNDHLVKLIKAVEGSACAKDTMVLVTYDEFGGQWDHAPPPGQGSAPGPHDEWGPGTRIPALTLSPLVSPSFVVDYTQHDTTSLITTLEHRYKLQPLGARDAAVKDMSSVFAARPAVR